MKQSDIERIKSLDPDSLNGTLQSILLREDISKVQFSEAVFWLLKTTLQEKQAVWEENQKYVRILRENGLYVSEVMFN